MCNLRLVFRLGFCVVICLLVACDPNVGGDGKASEKPTPIEFAYATADLAGKLSAPVVRESSGLAESRLDDHLLWTHNDSGGGPFLYAFSDTGELRARLMVRGSQNIDWEDMASFTLADQSYLLVADVGNNERTPPRDFYSLYIVPEPQIEAAEQAQTHTADVLREVRFQYEDGPRNCEAVAVDATAGKVYLVEKLVAPRSAVYELDLPDLSKKPGPEALVAQRIGYVPLLLVTAMDVSTDGRLMVILTYTAAYAWAREPDEDWSAALKRTPLRVTTPSQRQAEAICVDGDGRSLWLTSEGLPTPLWRIEPLAEKP